MAAVFGDILGYRTNTRFVPAIATSDEAAGLVDLVLVGTANALRAGVTIAASKAAATVGQAYLVDTNN